MKGIPQGQCWDQHCLTSLLVTRTVGSEKPPGRHLNSLLVPEWTYKKAEEDFLQGHVAIGQGVMALK